MSMYIHSVSSVFVPLPFDVQGVCTLVVMSGTALWADSMDAPDVQGTCNGSDFEPDWEDGETSALADVTAPVAASAAPVAASAALCIPGTRVATLEEIRALQSAPAAVQAAVAAPNSFYPPWPAASAQPAATPAQPAATPAPAVPESAASSAPPEATPEAAVEGPALAGLTEDTPMRVDVEEEKPLPYEAVHYKYMVGVTNWGALRKKGEEVYAKNMYNLSVFIALTMECDEGHVRQVEEPRDVWIPAEHQLELNEPLQGFDEVFNTGCGEMKMVKKWKCSEMFHGLCVVGRCSRVQSFRILDKLAIPFHGKYSKLMLVEVTWRAPINEATTVKVIVGHLHNELAKKTKAEKLRRFWDKLADLCAGGGGGEGRLIGMDANMAMFGVLPEMAERGVGLTLLCHHMELADPERTEDPSLKWDTLGLWLVGPVDITKCKKLSPNDHIFWGAAHPKSLDLAWRSYDCGYPQACHSWPPPFECPALAGFLKAKIDETREELVGVVAGDKRCEKDFGIVPWVPAEMPKWWSDKKERLAAWHNTKADFFCAGGRIDSYTYMRESGHQPPMHRTDELPMLPGCNEVMAQAVHWDPFGMRWGRGAHWPLLATIGTGRYRSAQMQEKRSWHNWEKNEMKRQARWVSKNEVKWIGPKAQDEQVGAGGVVGPALAGPTEVTLTAGPGAPDPWTESDPWPGWRSTANSSTWTGR